MTTRSQAGSFVEFMLAPKAPPRRNFAAYRHKPVRRKGRNSDRDGFQDRIVNDLIIGARLNQ
jgi:hypothetical protein